MQPVASICSLSTVRTITTFSSQSVDPKINEAENYSKTLLVSVTIKDLQHVLMLTAQPFCHTCLSYSTTQDLRKRHEKWVIKRTQHQCMLCSAVAALVHAKSTAFPGCSKYGSIHFHFITCWLISYYEELRWQSIVPTLKGRSPDFHGDGQHVLAPFFLFNRQRKVELALS